MTPADVRAPAATAGQVVVTAAVGVAATAAVALVDPHRPGHYPECPLLWATGIYCPLCGGLRAVHDLTHLDLGAALDRNPLVVLGIPFALLAWGLWAQRAFTGRRLGSFPTWLGWGLLVVLVGFGILRNLPGWSFLSPA